MMTGPRTPGAGVRKPPREETAGGVAKLRVRGYGDFGAGGLLPRCVDRLFGERSKGWRASVGRSRWAEPAARRGAWSWPAESGRSRSAVLECRREPGLIMMCRF